MKLIRSLALLPMLFAFAAHAEKRIFDYSVDAEIDASGVVTSANVIDEIPAAFEATVVGLIKQWRFKPGKLNGVPAVVNTTLYAQVIADIVEGKSATITAKYVSHGVRYGQITAPKYPESSVRMKHQAEIVMLVKTGVNGKPTEISLYSARVLGGKTATNLFTMSATAAIQQWRMQPERVAGNAVSGKFLVPVHFQIPGRTAKLKTMVAPPAETVDQIADKKLDWSVTKAVAIDNATGLELISDGSKS